MLSGNEWLCYSCRRSEPGAAKPPAHPKAMRDGAVRGPRHVQIMARERRVMQVAGKQSQMYAKARRQRTPDPDAPRTLAPTAEAQEHLRRHGFGIPDPEPTSDSPSTEGEEGTTDEYA